MYSRPYITAANRSEDPGPSGGSRTDAAEDVSYAVDRLHKSVLRIWLYRLGKIRGAGVMEFSLALFAVQMAVSVYWLRFFPFGPAEWLWRSLA